MQPLFKHKPLDRSKTTLRLIKVLPERVDGQIACEVTSKQLPAVFTALSYCWGSEQETAILLRHAGSPTFAVCNVRQNLHSFLKHIAKRPGETWIWIDAICIDQSNLMERNHQVQQIGNVYQQAQEVLVWLGSDPVLAKGLSICAKAITTNDNPNGKLPALLEATKQSYPFDLPELLERIQSHPFFSRLWIIQEVVLASPSGLKVMCRNVALPWAAFSIIHDFVKSTVVAEWPGAVQSSDVSTIESLAILRYEFETKGRHAMSDILAFTSSAQCSDVRDRVYGLLSLVENGQHFEVDYGIGVNALLCRAFIFFQFEMYPLATRALITALKPSVGRFFQALSTRAEFLPTQPMILQRGESGSLSQLVIQVRNADVVSASEEMRASSVVQSYRLTDRYINVVDPTLGPEWMISASSIPSWFDSTPWQDQHRRREPWINLETQVMPIQELCIVFRNFGTLSGTLFDLFQDLEDIRSIFSCPDFEQRQDEPIPACFTFAATEQVLIDPRSASSINAFAGSITPRYLYLHLPPRLVKSLLTRITYVKKLKTVWKEPMWLSSMTQEQWLSMCDTSLQEWLKPFSMDGVTYLESDTYLISKRMPGSQRYLYTVTGGRCSGKQTTDRDEGLGY